MEHLTADQKKLVKKLGEHVADQEQKWRDEENLARWLRARKWNVSKAEKMLRKSINWRKEHRIDSLLEEFEAPEVAKKYFPGVHFGEDKLGHPLYIDPIGRIDLKGMLYSVKKDELIKSRVLMLEELHRCILPEQSKKHGKKITQVTHIMDFANFGKQHLWIPGGELYRDIIAALEANYPETLYKSYVINAPAIFHVAFSFIKPFMAEDTLKKVEFLGANWKERLLEVIDADQLPAHYGGTCTDPDGDIFCSSKICWGGLIPESYYRKKEELIPADKSFENIYIKRRSVYRLEFEVKQCNAVLRWVFTSENRNISFGVYFKETGANIPVKKMEVVVSPSRVTSHIVPEDGIVHCNKLGTYVLEFDNSFSVLRGKRISYFVELITDIETGGDFTVSNLRPSRTEQEELDTDTETADGADATESIVKTSL